MGIFQRVSQRMIAFAIMIIIVLGAWYAVRWYANVQDFNLLEQQASLFSAGRIVGVSGERILVEFAEGMQGGERAQIVKKYNLRERGNIPKLGVRMYALPEGGSAEAITGVMMSENPEKILFAEPDYAVEPSVIPDDPWYVSWQRDKVIMRAPEAWDISTGANVRIAVLDTGVNCQHEDLSGVCVSGWNVLTNAADATDAHGHGTAVAGVLGAIGNNTVGVAGGTWASEIMPIVVGGSNGEATYSSIASGIVYAAEHGARVVNNSYQSGGSSAVARAASYLGSKGGLLVVSEGNYGERTRNKANPNIISVGAVDAQDTRYSWSSYGADIDLVAPGCTGATTSKDGGYGSFCGTSASAPEVASTIALMWSANPALLPSDIMNVLMSSSVDLGKSGWDEEYGWGRIDMARAVAEAKTALPGTSNAKPFRGKN